MPINNIGWKFAVSVPNDWNVMHCRLCGRIIYGGITLLKQQPEVHHALMFLLIYMREQMIKNLRSFNSEMGLDFWIFDKVKVRGKTLRKKLGKLVSLRMAYLMQREIFLGGCTLCGGLDDTLHFINDFPVFDNFTCSNRIAEIRSYAHLRIAELTWSSLA